MNIFFSVECYCKHLSLPAEVLILSIILFMCLLRILCSSSWKYHVLLFTVKEMSKRWQNKGADVETCFSLAISFC